MHNIQCIVSQAESGTHRSTNAASAAGKLPVNGAAAAIGQFSSSSGASARRPSDRSIATSARFAPNAGAPVLTKKPCTPTLRGG